MFIVAKRWSKTAAADTCTCTATPPPATTLSSYWTRSLTPGTSGTRSWWKRTTAHSSVKKWAPVHDTLLYYATSSAATWNELRLGYNDAYLDKYYRFDDG